MRTLAPAEKELIDAVVNEYDPRYQNITAGLLEKDLHLTEALRVIFTLPLENITPVFCGGTSLSKAYRLIDRMSEDADIKLVQSPDFQTQSKAQQKKHLSLVKEQVQQALEKVGFGILNITAQNENRYIRLDLEYARTYASVGGLRPHVQIELISKALRLASQTRRINTLMHQLIEREEGALSVQTMDLAETLVEKVLSFLRRYAQEKAGLLRHEWDSALVRHLYDVHRIMKGDADSVVKASRIFKETLMEECTDWGSQFPEFASDPVRVLRSALHQSALDQDIQAQYRVNLIPLIYGTEKPEFQVAFDDFAKVAQTLIDRAD